MGDKRGTSIESLSHKDLWGPATFFKGLKENDNKSTFAPFESFEVNFSFCFLKTRLRAYEVADIIR